MDTKRIDIDTEHLVALARIIARFKGSAEKIVYHCGCSILNAQVYQGKSFRVIAAIDSLELGLDRLENNNPTTCVDPQGEIYRKHGEQCYIAREILEIARDLLNEILLEQA